MEYLTLAQESDGFKHRSALSQAHIRKIKEAFDSRIDSAKYRDISVYCGGSLGRGDAGDRSYLDLFILSHKSGKSLSRLENLELLASIVAINKELGFPQFSNDGQYLQVYSFPDMLKAVGSPSDDVQNLFTVRMLLLLESRPIFNESLYWMQVDSALDHYFRDSRGKESFKPLFLVNDILRYWRTVCLNYELIRNDKSRPWRKKNINLKFSRMLTAFATVLPLIAKPASNKDCASSLIQRTPLERLAIGLDLLGDLSMRVRFAEFLSVYEEFLSLKEKMGSRAALDDASIDRRTGEMASIFSWFLHDCLTHNNIKREYVKYLIL